MYKPKLLAILFLAIPFAMAETKTEFGTTDSGAWGLNRTNQTVGILPSTIYTYKNDDKGQRTDEMVSEVPFDDECIWLGPSPGAKAHALDCSSGKASPLAGTYFKVRFSKEHSNECGRGTIIYECTVKCESPSVPRVFVEEPYEC